MNASERKNQRKQEPKKARTKETRTKELRTRTTNRDAKGPLRTIDQPASQPGLNEGPRSAAAAVLSQAGSREASKQEREREMAGSSWSQAPLDSAFQARGLARLALPTASLVEIARAGKN